MLGMVVVRRYLERKESWLSAVITTVMKGSEMTSRFLVSNDVSTCVLYLDLTFSSSRRLRSASTRLLCGFTTRYHRGVNNTNHSK